MSRVNRPVSTRVGCKRNAIEVNNPNSNNINTQQRQKQIAQRDKLRVEYVKELENLEQQYQSYKTSQRLNLQSKLDLYSERLSQIKDIAELQQAIALKAQTEDIRKQLESLDHDYDLQLIGQLKRLIACGSHTGVKKEEEPKTQSAGTNTTYLQPFLDKFQKAPLNLFQDDDNGDKQHGEDTEFCPEHKTRLVMTVEDGSMSCTECGYHTACVDTSVDTPSMEDASNAKDASMDKVIKLFTPVDHELTEEELRQSGGSKPLISLERGVEFCKEQREKKRLRGVPYDRVSVTDIDTWLKTSKNKELSVRFGHCHLALASELNETTIPQLTPNEIDMIKRLRLSVKGGDHTAATCRRHVQCQLCLYSILSDSRH